MAKEGNLVGKIQTVTGIIDADMVGVTLPHEHLLTDSSWLFIEPQEASERKRTREPVGLENRYWVILNRFSNIDNTSLTDEELILKELSIFKAAGGTTIVEMSCGGLCRDPLGLARIARLSGINVIMGAGYYVGRTHPPELANWSEEWIAKNIVSEITEGVENTGIRAGIIGEVGCSPILEVNERKVLRASAVAQRQTGAAINIHPGPSHDAVMEIIDVLESAGADLTRVVISHCDVFGYEPDTLSKIVEAGCYIEYDTFGHDGIHPLYLGHMLPAPSDTQRIYNIVRMIEDGYLDNLLLSSDLCLKHLMVTYGGYGYAHIPRDVVPVLKHMNITDEQIERLLIENPRRLLSFVRPK